MKKGFDRVAAPYRWMEYISFGRSLQRCRMRFLADLAETRSALLLGDGDGRFAAQFLLTAPSAQALAVDGSAKMLATLRHRCDAVGVGSRVILSRADVTHGVDWPSGRTYDLVATHFFLDCLTDAEVSQLVSKVQPLLQPEARWVISEFDIPSGAMRIPARLLVAGLYAAFRLLTGLRVQRLPDYAAVFQRHGFIQSRHVTSLGGLLVSEVWVLSDL